MRIDWMQISLLLTMPLLFALTPAARGDSVTFVAIPEAVSGPAGTTVGWGYSITNNSTTDYLDITGVDADVALAVDGAPDAAIFDLPNLAPLATVTEAYDPGSFHGLFQFTWNSGLPAGTTVSGVFTLYGAFCTSSDPFCADDLSVPITALATTPYSATVAPNSSTPLTEPPAFSLLALLMALAGIAGRRTYSARRVWTASAAVARRASVTPFCWFVE